eukprot:EG_transcript_14312
MYPRATCGGGKHAPAPTGSLPSTVGTATGLLCVVAVGCWLAAPRPSALWVETARIAAPSMAAPATTPALARSAATHAPITSRPLPSMQRYVALQLHRVGGQQQAPFDFALGCVGAVLLAMAGYLLGWRRARPSWLLLTTAGEPTAENPLDPLITQLRQAAFDDLQRLVAENMPRLGPPFFLRIAELSDRADSLEEKAQLAAFSRLMVKTMETMYAQAEEKATELGSVVLDLLKLCAEDNGEFLLPLPEAKLAAVRTAIRRRLKKYATDNFVSTIRAYIKKAADDKLEGVVVILQKIFQVYVAELLRGMCVNLKEGERCTATMIAVLTALLDADEERWDAELQTTMFSDTATVDPGAFCILLNEEVGGMLFQLPAGSPLQQVCAEYIQEILERINKLKQGQQISEEDS